MRDQCFAVIPADAGAMIVDIDLDQDGQARSGLLGRGAATDLGRFGGVQDDLEIDAALPEAIHAASASFCGLMQTA